MSARLAAKIARRELRSGVSGFRIFLACLILGVAAIAAVGTVREGVQAGLQREGAVLLGGDAEVEFTYRFPDQDERTWIEAQSVALSEIVDFRSMAVVGEGETAERALTQVKSVDDAYPLIGEVALQPEVTIAQALEGNGSFPGAVMEPVLMARLGLAVGDQFKLGAQEFVLTASLVREPDSAVSGFSLGPRTIVATDALAESGLIQPGTLFETQYRMLLPAGADLAALEQDAMAKTEGGRWRDRRNGAPGISVFVERLSAFLVLVGLAGLAVGGVGISAAVNSYLERKTEVIAILKSLGARSSLIFQTYFLQIGILALIGLAVGVVLGSAVPIALAPIIEARLPVPVALTFYPSAMSEAVIYGALASLIFTLWPLARIEELRPALLFREGADAGHRMPRLIWMLIVGGLLVALVLLASWFSGLWRLTLGAAFGVVVSFVLLALAALGVRWLARVLARGRLMRGKSALRIAVGSIAGPRSEAMSVILSLGLGLTVLAAVGQIEANLRGAISRDLPEVAPSFFMVDIQPGQMEAFQAQMANDASVSKVDNAPMLRGVITEINGRPASEISGDHWVLSGDRGVTYSAEPGEGTKITEGEWWEPDYSGPPLISFAAEEGEELGLSLGDVITVNILGRDIVATIASFREVDFSTAGIGFVISMNPAALAGAPHSFIATIYAEDEAEARILRETAAAFPNITAIPVKDAILRVSEILAGIAAAITYGAMAALVTGGVVLIGAAAAGVQKRVYEAAILKTLGATRGIVLASFAMRSAFLGFAAGLVAVMAGGIAGWAVMEFVMETEFHFEPVSAVLVALGGVLMTVLASLVFVWVPLAARPSQVLRARE